MRNLLLLFILLAGNITLSRAQSLYMPRDLEYAYRKGARSMDGKPGSQYWQNNARYEMELDIMPPDRLIKGHERITYFNHSHDTLKQVFVKLIMNVHRPGAARDQEADSAFFSTGMLVDSFAVDDQQIQWQWNASAHTVQEIQLPRPLPPGDSVRFFFRWHYSISLNSEREGMIDPTTFFLAYFYPKIAVYDDYNGWDRLEFTNLQEFYSDFNNYTFTVNVPSNFLVWATGTLQNPDEVLNPVYVKRFEQSKRSDTAIHIVSAADIAAKNVTARKKINTWRWKADSVPDIAIAVSDHFVWDAASVAVDSATARRASVQAVYNDTTTGYRQMVENSRETISLFSHNWPGIPYPYPSMTVFQGFSAMEYPMMANVLVTPIPRITRFLADHEIAHTYFPFYMGIHETKYPFMDEGWANFFELLNSRVRESAYAADELFKQWWVYNWVYNSSSESNLPIITPAVALKNPVYGINAYAKSSVAYLALKDMLGDSLFRKCLHGFMKRWCGKHPSPWDFFNTFNHLSGKDMNWFWNNWFFSSYHIDLGVKNVSKTKTGYAVFVENTGGLFVPVSLQVQFADGSDMNVHKTPEIWKDSRKQVTVNIATIKKIRSVVLQPGVFVDPNDANNRFVIPLDEAVKK